MADTKSDQVSTPQSEGGGHLPTPPTQNPREHDPLTSRGVPQSQTPGHASFRRQRASRACETCHARKVRCDAASLGVPCTNCVAFSIECRIPAPKRKKTSGKTKDEESEQGDTKQETTPTLQHAGSNADDNEPPDNEEIPYTAPEQGILDIRPSDGGSSGPGSVKDENSTQYPNLMKPKFVRAPIKEAGRVAYLGESSNLSLLVHDRYGTTDVVHYPLPENMRGNKAKASELDSVEMDILHTRGAFLLPPRGLCDELVDAFFTWIAPIVPVINRSKFMRRYRDPKNPPSLLLLQSILLAGSRVCNNPQLMDATGSTTPAAMTFYKRAKALFDAGYEDDRVTLVQSVILMGWYWEGPEDVTKNVFYWTRIAVIIAQGSGMHRSVESSQLSKGDKRLWKRIWWTLFTRDRSVAVALGRPCCINVEDSDVEMVTEDDFIDEEDGRPSDYPADPVHVHFFLNYVKLTEIMGVVLSQQYSVASRLRQHNALDLTQSDMALADWLQNCPKEVYWERPRHHFWSALLHSHYYTTLCLLHRAHMPPAGTPHSSVQNGYVVETQYPSRNIAYQAAGMITSIIESLKNNDQLRYTPAFIVYSLFSALIMHVYQMRSSNQAIVAATEKRMHICMNALKEVSKVWLVAKMVHTLFDSILGNKMLEERLAKAAGRRHQKPKRPAGKGAIATSTGGQDPQNQGTGPQLKRNFEEMEMGTLSNGPPAAQMSYERSRPQTPAPTPPHQSPSQQRQQTQTNHHANHSHSSSHQDMPTLSATASSPNFAARDTFMGASRQSTRPGSPSFGQSFPGTPAPDVFLVTRNSPTLPVDSWSNFQPDQLFPADTGISLPTMSPNSTGDDAMQYSQGPNGQQQQQQQQQQQHQQQQHQQQQMHHLSPHQNDPNSWAQVDAMNARPQTSEETWSNSSVSGGAPVPTHLNVEDWFSFFGIHGDLNVMNSQAARTELMQMFLGENGLTDQQQLGHLQLGSY